MPAAHRPSSLLRRAIALKRSSSSCANIYSKPSSRLANVVVIPPLMVLLMALDRIVHRPDNEIDSAQCRRRAEDGHACFRAFECTHRPFAVCIPPGQGQDNASPRICGEYAEWKTALWIDCVGGIDRLGCERVRSFAPRFARIFRSAPRTSISNRSHGRSDGLSQTTVHSDEPPSPYLRRQGEGPL